MLLAAVLAAGALAQAPFPGAPSAPICGKEGIPYPQAALATAGSGMWLACRRARKLLLLDAKTGATRRALKTPGLSPFSVAASGGRVWVIDWNRSALAPTTHERASCARGSLFPGSRTCCGRAEV